MCVGPFFHFVVVIRKDEVFVEKWDNTTRKSMEIEQLIRLYYVKMKGRD